MLVINARFLTQKISGVQRYAIEISKELKKAYPKVRFIAPQNILHYELAEELGVEKYGKFTGHLWEQIDLLRYLRQNNEPLLLNFSGLSPLLYHNKLTTIFDLSFLRHPEWFSNKYYYFYKYLLPLSNKYSNEIITISDHSKREIIKFLHFPENRLSVVYCSVPEGFGNNKEINSSKVCDKYILSVSSIDPRKNISNLLLAFNSLEIPNVKLIIIGSESSVFKKQVLQNVIHSNKNIHFTGYLSDNELAAYYKNATAFIYPSLYEGFGIPPIEAMAFGCPTIVSNTTSLPEVCGSAAYYVNPYDINDIALGMKTLLQDDILRKELIEKGYERIKLFSWKTSALKIVEIIKKYETLEKSSTINLNS